MLGYLLQFHERFIGQISGCFEPLQRGRLGTRSHVNKYSLSLDDVVGYLKLPRGEKTGMAAVKMHVRALRNASLVTGAKILYHRVLAREDGRKIHANVLDFHAPTGGAAR